MCYCLISYSVNRVFECFLVIVFKSCESYVCFLGTFMWLLLWYTQYIIRYLFSSPHTAMCHYCLLMTIYDMWLSIGVGFSVFVIAWEKVWVQSFMLFLSLFCRHRCGCLWVCRCFVNHVSGFCLWLTVTPLCQSNHKLWGIILIKPFPKNNNLLDKQRTSYGVSSSFCRPLS